MSVGDVYGDELESPYAVPTHLEASESIGPVPHRVWAVSLGAWMASSMLLATFHPVDGEYVRTFALRDFPATITTDWWSHLTDGDLPVDIAMNIRPRDVGDGKRQLDRREIALATSRPTREREVALEQVRALAMAMERSHVKPYDVAITLAIRGSTRSELEQLDRRLRQRLRDRGNATIHLLRWEQMEGLERVVQLGRLPLPRRTRRVETGTLARTTPLCSATLQLEGGVPLGEAGSAPCLFWTRAGQKNAHMAVYGGSGAGKGYLMRV